MSKHSPNAADEEKLLVSLLYQAQAIAVRLDIDLVEKTRAIFSKSFFWEPQANSPEIIKPEESSEPVEETDLNPSQKVIFEIILDSEKALSPKEIYKHIKHNGDKITHYSYETVRSVCRFLDQSGLVKRTRQEGRVVYHAE